MKKNLYVMYALALLQGMAFYGPIATLYRQAQGVTVFEITVIESISLVLGILLEIPWGMIADKIGYRKTMIFCSSLYFISKFVFWQATGFWGFLTERIMLSVVLAGYSGVDSSIIYLSCEGTDSQKAFGLYSSMSMAGLLIAAAVFSVFVGDNYWLAGLLTVISYGLAMVLSFGLTEVRQTDAEETETEPFRESFRQIFSNRTLLVFLVGVALLSEAHQTITVFLNQLQYLECTFPFMGVRFISINDGYDSDDYRGTTGGLEVVMRSIIYAAYSKDLSVKTTTAKIQMMKQGKYVGGYAPYGYVLHPEIRNKLKLDPEAAEVIRRVFDEALEGRNTSQIALSLNDDNIPTPGQYFKSKHPDKKKFSRMSDKISWTASMVYKILANYVYTGATVGHRRRSDGVGSRKSIPQDREDWIVVEGMHEAIISKEEFEQAQAVIRGGNKKPERKPRYYPLKGLVCCGNCKRALTRRKRRNESGYFYECTHSTHDRDTECLIGERYSEAWLENTVYNSIGQMLALVEKKAVKEHEISKRRKSAISECADTIRDLQKQSEQLKAVKLRLYEKYTSGSITKAEYLKRKAETDAKMVENEEAIRQGHERMQELDSEHPCSDEKLDKVLGEYQKDEGLTYELAHALISAIYVHGQDSIEIVWKFKDIFESTETE